MWMDPSIDRAVISIAATGNDKTSKAAGDEGRTFEDCVEEAWKLDVYSSSEAETSTGGESRQRRDGHFLIGPG